MENKCGIQVTTIIGGITGIITCESHRFDKITYELSYFYNGDYKTVWMHESEFTEIGNNQIGFKQR